MCEGGALDIETFSRPVHLNDQLERGELIACRLETYRLAGGIPDQVPGPQVVVEARSQEDDTNL